jgi:hypothetical protein
MILAAVVRLRPSASSRIAPPVPAPLPPWLEEVSPPKPPEPLVEIVPPILSVEAAEI